MAVVCEGVHKTLATGQTMGAHHVMCDVTSALLKAVLVLRSMVASYDSDVTELIENDAKYKAEMLEGYTAHSSIMEARHSDEASTMPVFIPFQVHSLFLLPPPPPPPPPSHRVFSWV